MIKRGAAASLGLLDAVGGRGGDAGRGGGVPLGEGGGGCGCVGQIEGEVGLLGGDVEVEVHDGDAEHLAADEVGDVDVGGGRHFVGGFGGWLRGFVWRWLLFRRLWWWGGEALCVDVYVCVYIRW